VTFLRTFLPPMVHIETPGFFVREMENEICEAGDVIGFLLYDDSAIKRAIKVPSRRNRRLDWPCHRLQVTN
jgi:hypothetical protein